MAYLSYPLHNRDDYKGRIIFEAKQEITSTLSESVFNGVINPLLDNGGEAVADIVPGNPGDESSYPDRQIPATPERAFTGDDNQTFEAPIPTYEQRGAISMYLPSTLQFNDRINYADADLGLKGGAAFNAIRSGASGRDVVGAGISALLNSFGSLGDAFSAGLSSEAAQVAALRLVSASSELTGAVEVGTGITLNPNRRSTMKDVPIRSFQFAFKLIPTSEEEMQAIDGIVKFFRAEMYPESVSAAGVPVAFKFPSKFFIKMMYGDKKVGTGILPCFLESASVVYNPNNMAFHKDGNPQELDLTLIFREERALTKKDIIEMSGNNPAYEALLRSPTAG